MLAGGEQFDRFQRKVAVALVVELHRMQEVLGQVDLAIESLTNVFDPTVGVRLVSFAVHWVRAEMHEFILKNWRIVKVATTKAQRKLFFNLRKSKKRLGWMNDAEVTAVANDLKVSKREVLEMESRLSGRDVGFDAPADEDKKGEHADDNPSGGDDKNKDSRPIVPGRISVRRPDDLLVFDVTFGGGEANVAVSLAHYGFSAFQAPNPVSGLS